MENFEKFRVIYYLDGKKFKLASDWLDADGYAAPHGELSIFDIDFIQEQLDELKYHFELKFGHPPKRVAVTLETK